MIILHILAYVLVIIVNILLLKDSVSRFLNLVLIQFEISCICSLVIYFFCNLILGLIVNQLVTKILTAEI